MRGSSLHAQGAIFLYQTSNIRRADRNLLIHRMHLDDNYVVLDVNSGAVHIIDAMIYNLLGFYDGTNPEETKPICRQYPAEDVAEAWRNSRTCRRPVCCFLRISRCRIPFLMNRC